jgi:taspase (threonine aspartase 1)
LTNAGLGSNLTLNERVECDASIMDRDGFGSVGAVSNVKNPIMVSLSLLEAQAKGTLSMGRIVPCMLVAEGARQWAHENHIEEVDDDCLKTEAVVKSHTNYKQRLNRINEALAHDLKETNLATGNGNGSVVDRETKIFDREAIIKLDESHPLDTVGAIVMDRSGHMASGVSSGGILLKHPGRVGHASMFGCGCWVEENLHFVEDDRHHENHSIAICTTGCGEYILKTLLAKECAAYISRHHDKIDYNLNEFFKKKFFSKLKLLKKIDNST